LNKIKKKTNPGFGKSYLDKLRFIPCLSGIITESKIRRRKKRSALNAELFKGEQN